MLIFELQEILYHGMFKMFLSYNACLSVVSLSKIPTFVIAVPNPSDISNKCET